MTTVAVQIPVGQNHLPNGVAEAQSGGADGAQKKLVEAEKRKQRKKLAKLAKKAAR